MLRKRAGTKIATAAQDALDAAGARTDDQPAPAGTDDPAHGRVWLLTPGLVLRLWLVEAPGLVPPDLPVPREDHDALRWLAREELASVPWLPADAAAVDALARRVGGPSREDADRQAGG